MNLFTNNGLVMFDTPWDTPQFQPLLDNIKFNHNMNVLMCIATHCPISSPYSLFQAPSLSDAIHWNADIYKDTIGFSVRDGYKPQYS